LEITRACPTRNWKLEVAEQTAWVKHDARHFRFNLVLQPQSRRTVRYRLTMAQGQAGEQKAKEAAFPEPREGPTIEFGR